MTKDCHLIHAQLVSRSPGRIRLRVASLHRHPQKIDPLIRSLQQHLVLYRVRANAGSGSITVFHARELSTFEDVKAILQDLGIILHDITEATPAAFTGKSEAATEVTKAVNDLNQRVQRATQGAIDLRFLVPFSFSLLALRQLAIKGWQLELIPWYVLAWYAFDSFIKLHSTNESPQNFKAITNTEQHE